MSAARGGTPTPVRSDEQRREALALANQIRSARAEFKRDLRHDRELILEAIESPPEWLLTAKVTDLLLAMPKFGPVKVQKVLKGLDISPSKTVGGLSDRQRGMLVFRLWMALGAPERMGVAA